MPVKPENLKAYREKNKEKIRIYKLIARSRRSPKDILRRAKHQAIKRNLDFDLTLEDIVIPDLCPYLKIPLTTIAGQGRCWSNISLDRIDSSKGYVKGNVQIMSDLANRMKSSATKEQMIQFAKSVLEMYGSS